jgi:vancomycin resistance protein YoaR
VSLLHLLVTLAVAGVLWAGGALFQTAYAGRIYPHVTIDQVPVGGMTRAEALAALRDAETARLHAPIDVQVAGKHWQVTPAQFGTTYDITAAVDRALALAHTGPFMSGGWHEATTIWSGANLPLTGAHDPAALARFLARVARAVHRAPRSASVGVQGNDVAILRESALGQRLDSAGAAAALSAALDRDNATRVTLPLQPVESALGPTQAEAALAHARALLAAPIQFLWTAQSSQSWLLSRSNMLRLLTFTPRCAPQSCRFDLGINVHKLAEAFNRGGVAARVDRPPIPASYVLYVASNPRASSVRVQPDSPGVAIDVARAAAAVLQEAAVPPGNRTIYLPTQPLYSHFTAAAAAALHFDRDVGYGGAHYAGLDWARQDNLNVAANVIGSTIVPPRATFSMAGRAGPLTAKGGYTRGQNQVGPDDITGVNGGVDQVAAAVLAAAYDAGLPIVQRVHYPYLSAFTSPGLDAMVTYRKRAPDLVFRNTTDHPILVMASNDSRGGVGVYIFNRAGYAPSHQRGPYTSTVSAPQVTLNPDGSVDAVITRSVTVGGHTTQDQLASHTVPIDP